MGNFSEEVAYVRPQDTNSIEYTLQSDEVQMSKNRDRNRNHVPQSKYFERISLAILTFFEGIKGNVKKETPFSLCYSIFVQNLQMVFILLFRE